VHDCLDDVVAAAELRSRVTALELTALEPTAIEPTALEPTVLELRAPEDGGAQAVA